MFITRDDIKSLTGYVQPAAQIRWLRKNGITHFVRADGKPVVPTNAFERAEVDPAVNSPNFAALRARN